MSPNEIEELLLEMKLQSVEEKNCVRDNVLHLAILHKKLQIAKVLILEGKVGINDIDLYGCTPLHFASIYNYPDLVRLLLEHGAKIDNQDTGGRTTLHFAAIYGHAEVGKILLEYHANVDIVDNSRSTALDFAVQYSHPEIADLLRNQPLRANTPPRILIE